MAAGQVLNIDPSVVYVMKGNIAYPGTQTQATADEGKAQTLLNSRLSPVTLTVPGGSIKVANP